MEDLDTLLQTTARHIARYRKALPGARVAPIATLDELIAGFDRPLTDESVPAAQVIDELVRAASPGLVASAGPRYFGFVTGGSVDAALCADLLTVGWDQLAFNAVTSPAAVAAEVVAGRWVKELLGLPAHASVGFVTGGQAANTAGLAAGRQHVLAHIGWDVARDGLAGAPRVRVLVGEERHATVDRAVRLLGLGARAIEPVAVDAQGAIDIRELEQALARDAGTPTIVCAQAGNVASGAFDDLRAVCRLARARGAWVHVDGAFGLWAAASSRRRALVDGVELADSWACDAHKWLNVPYDSGLALCAHPEVHAAALRYEASYLTGQDGPPALGGADYTPESSRRARGMAVWAAIRSLGRDGIAGLVDRCCDHASRFARLLDAHDGVRVVNDVVLNQVLVAFDGADDRADRIVARIQEEGTCWLGAATWQGRRVMRISVSGWSTTEHDVDRSVAAILTAVDAEP